MHHPRTTDVSPHEWQLVMNLLVCVVFIFDAGVGSWPSPGPGVLRQVELGGREVLGLSSCADSSVALTGGHITLQQ